LRRNLVLLAESERNLVASREQIQLILDSSAEGIFGIDRNCIITFINPAAVKILGYGSSLALLGKDSHEFLPHCHSGESPYPYQDCDLWRTLMNGITSSCESGVFRRPDGTTFPVGYCVAPLSIDGDVRGAVISFEDISDRIAMMDQLQSSLREKEILLKEIHHRVKNNLQIVASLLNLQGRYIRDESIQHAIRESQNRVRAMALVHERLYRSGDLSQIDTGDYVRYLVTNLLTFYGVSSQKISAKVSISGIFLDINTMIPLGLVFNELISNSLKYAFPDGRVGAILISGTLDPDGSRVITIHDNGIGIPEGFDWKNSPSLGLRLVGSLVEQIRGRIELIPGEGTTWVITIPPAAKPDPDASAGSEVPCDRPVPPTRTGQENTS
jgi:PAS domain S-box-containing protein